MTQKHVFAGGGDDGDDQDIQETGQVQIEGADGLLDEIDGLLEANAEEFVRSYVQKGGQ